MSVRPWRRRNEDYVKPLFSARRIKIDVMNLERTRKTRTLQPADRLRAAMHVGTNRAPLIRHHFDGSWNC